MKTIIKRAIRDEKGAGVLALVLVLLVVGGLILTPLLGLMSTGLMAGQVYEKKTHELYSADAGVEDVMWKILYEPIPSELWEASDLPDWDVYKYLEPLSVGNKSVEVVVYRKDRDLTPCRGDFTYRVLSTAVTDDASGTAGIESATTVEAYVEPLVFDLVSGALVSSKGIDFSGGCTVTGDVYFVENITGKGYNQLEGISKQIPLSAFPTQEEIEEFAQQFKDQALLGGTYNGSMSIESNTTLGPLYITGSLDISQGVTVTLNGTIYVEGSIGSRKEYTVRGSGSIVAVGNIDLHMMPDYGVEGDTIIMSLNGDIKFWKVASIEAMVYAPNGFIDIEKDMTVYGGIIGAGINVKKDSSFTYIAKGNSFGLFEPVVYGAEIKTYTINPAV